jgi:two-component system, chemotaxis family, CheB/CheR fusion protein
MKRDERTEQTSAVPVKEGTPRPGFAVVIGASAGALGALRTLFGGMPRDTGAAFIVVVGSPSPGRLVALLRPYTDLPISEAADDAVLEPNTILVMPRTVELRSIDTHLRLAGLPENDARPGRIDRALRALAMARGPRGIGAVLSGAGSDGALGLGFVKAHGGLTLAQDPGEAEHAGMPSSAIECGVVDLVLPLREFPGAIARYCRAQPRLPHQSGVAGAGEPFEPLEPRDLLDVLDLLKKHTGFDFSVFRRAVLTKRIAKRMRLLAIDEWPDYVERLQAERDEAGVLANDLLQNVTEFPRDDGAFAKLESEVLPQLFARKSGSQHALRAWVVGCSTGEAAYALAIALLERRASLEMPPRIQVFASDMSDQALQRARLGFYPAEIETAIPQERLAKYFIKEDDRGYRVRPMLREVLLFAAHNVVKDFPFSQLDLILCPRGLLENLKPDARRSVLRTFHYALLPHGLLVVDSSQRLEADAPQYFAHEGDGVYRRQIARASPKVPPYGEGMAMSLAGNGPEPAKPSVPDARSLHLGLLERYAPASVLTDADGRVIHYSQRASRFLSLPGGEVTHELVALLREPLRSAVRGGLEAVGRRSTKWSSDALLVHTQSGVRRVAVQIEPGDEASGAKLVVFQELGARQSVDEDNSRARLANDLTTLLEAQLDEARRQLRSVVADGEAAAAAGRHQPLVRALEDIDSAKEELQTVNEELSSLNEDSRARVEDLARLTADLEVLLESTGLATLFLDRDLKIVRFTAPSLEIFHVLPTDKGRALADVSHRLRDYELMTDARRVLKHVVPVEREVEADNGKWYLLRMLPYRSAPQGLDGVAITLVDITSRKKAELELREADRRKDEFIALLAHELRNPLAPISSGIEILRRRELDPAIAERVTLTMSRQAAQLVRLIDDLLDVSRINSGRLQLRKTPVALRDIVRDAVAAVRPLIERANHRLNIDMLREPIKLEADAARLTQVLANLLNNAARYTPAGGSIDVAVRREANMVAISVKDNGYGIPETTLPHVFEMFYQGADSRATTQSGLGIGLALAKSLVDMHGGTISAASAGRDRGSEFTLRLPTLVSSSADADVADAAAEPALGGHRVLVVDDNADAAQTLAMLIQTLGANDVHVALSGEEALPLAERIRPDTVFLDLKMGAMDGYEVAQRLRNEPWGEDAWLVALTGWGLDEHKRRTKDAGFDQHLIKPADRAALEAILSRPAAGRA